MSIIETTHKVITLRGSTDYSLVSVTSTGLIDEDYPSKGPVVTTVTHSITSYPAAYTKKQNTFQVLKKGDIKLYVDPVDPDDDTQRIVTPTTDDIITHSTKGDFRVKDVIEYKDGGEVLLYILQIRQ